MRTTSPRPARRRRRRARHAQRNAQCGINPTKWITSMPTAPRRRWATRRDRCGETLLRRTLKRVAISSTKSATGHLLGRRRGGSNILGAGDSRPGGSADINLFNQDPECDLDFVPNTARPMKIKISMSNSSDSADQRTLISARSEHCEAFPAGAGRLTLRHSQTTWRWRTCG